MSQLRRRKSFPPLPPVVLGFVASKTTFPAIPPYKCTCTFMCRFHTVGKQGSEGEREKRERERDHVYREHHHSYLISHTQHDTYKLYMYGGRGTTLDEMWQYWTCTMFDMYMQDFS